MGLNKIHQKFRAHINLFDPVNSFLKISMRAIKGNNKPIRIIRIIIICQDPIIPSICIIQLHEIENLFKIYYITRKRIEEF